MELLVERRLTAVVVAGLIAWPVAAPCQRISGRVSNALTGEALPGSQILLEQAGVRIGAAVADSSRMIAVDNATREYSLNIRLAKTAVALPEIPVSAQRTERRLRRAGFHERAGHGFGHFVTEAHIRTRNARVVTDALRGIPGVTVAPSAARSGSYEIYMARAQGRLRSARCPPKVFLDGIVTSVDFDDYLTPADVAGIEIYRGPAETPAQFGGAESDCGVIVIWTK